MIDGRCRRAVRGAEPDGRIPTLQERRREHNRDAGNLLVLRRQAPVFISCLNRRRASGPRLPLR
ncbi:hypothetical protein KL86PLE_130357 [uncultured Pleomorphomonas sp.]|uniref:Uncharacterized protein n=1 Tax=uncultured Pleomorphomonas sp. TaxID=442121 RepID=A0A212LBB9_9HYPH|nr:hypothetical protein KL86PLE_130357 [uncultured Pleomorphomonas sp.]